MDIEFKKKYLKYKKKYLKLLKGGTKANERRSTQYTREKINIRDGFKPGRIPGQLNYDRKSNIGKLRSIRQINSRDLVPLLVRSRPSDSTSSKSVDLPPLLRESSIPKDSMSIYRKMYNYFTIDRNIERYLYNSNNIFRSKEPITKSNIFINELLLNNISKSPSGIYIEFLLNALVNNNVRIIGRVYLSLHEPDSDRNNRIHIWIRDYIDENNGILNEKRIPLAIVYDDSDNKLKLDLYEDKIDKSRVNLQINSPNRRNLVILLINIMNKIFKDLQDKPMNKNLLFDEFDLIPVENFDWSSKEDNFKFYTQCIYRNLFTEIKRKKYYFEALEREKLERIKLLESYDKLAQKYKELIQVNKNYKLENDELKSRYKKLVDRFNDLASKYESLKKKSRK